MADSPVTDDLAYIEQNGPIKTTDPPAPDSLYGVSKLFGEDLGRYYSRMFGMQFIALRIGSAAPDRLPLKAMRENKLLRDHFLGMFLSKRDLVQAFDKALQVRTDYLVAYAVSNNSTRIFDLTETKRRMGYIPVDDSEDHFKDVYSS